MRGRRYSSCSSHPLAPHAVRIRNREWWAACRELLRRRAPYFRRVRLQPSHGRGRVLVAEDFGIKLIGALGADAMGEPRI
jgi:hypothetical protein